MDAYDIKVNLAQMSTVSTEITTITKGLVSNFSDMKNIMQGTALYWSGEAADLHRRSFQEQVADMESIFAKFEKQAQRLEKISGNYVDASQSVKRDMEALPSNPLGED